MSDTPMSHPNAVSDAVPQPDLGQVVAALQHLQQENAALKEHLLHLKSTVNALPQPRGDPHPTPEPKVALPAKYAGDRESFRAFTSQIRLVLRMQPHTYAADTSRVGLVGSLLTGAALGWFSPLIETNSPLLEDFEAFMAEFKSVFGDTDRVRVAAAQLRQLRQGSRPVASYAADFRQLACEVGWDEAALVDAFRYGLRDDVKDLLLTMPDATTLSDIVAQAVKCDNRLFERRRERQFSRAGPAPWHATMARQPSAPTTSFQQQRPQTLAADDPMQVDGAIRIGPLTADEKARRRRHGLCMYCGQAGHMVAVCPSKGRDHAFAATTTTVPTGRLGNDHVQTM